MDSPLQLFQLVWLWLNCCGAVVPGLILQPGDEMVVQQEGHHNSFFVSCQGEGKMVWKKGVNGISTNPQDRVHVEQEHFRRIDLVFRSLLQSDQGRYTCSEGIVEKFFDLVVVQPISFEDTGKTQMVQVGQPSFRLKCSVSGLPFPAVSWKVKGQSIRNSMDADVGPDAKYEVDGTDLLIRNIEKSDEGRYLCKAVQTVYDNDGVSVLHSDFKDFLIKLKIEQSPSWLDEVDGGQFYGFVTGTANLTCLAYAEPPPTFRWLDAENKPVENGRVINEENQSTLMLEVPHHHVFGAYTCIAENIHGRLEKVVMLSEGAKPGTPKIEPSRIFGESMDLRIQKPQAELFLHIEGFRVEIKEAKKPWETARLLEFKLAENSVYFVDGLLPQHFYHVRARSRNKAGLSDPSNIIYLKTTGDSPTQDSQVGTALTGSATQVNIHVSLLVLAVLARVFLTSQQQQLLSVST